MSLTSPAAVSVGTTATVIANGSSGGGGTSVEVYNADGAATVWLGDENVAVSTRGVPLAAGASKAYVLRAGDTLYGRAGSGTISVTTLQLSGSY